jgi:hypothetical protein
LFALLPSTCPDSIVIRWNDNEEVIVPSGEFTEGLLDGMFDISPRNGCLLKMSGRDHI